MMEIGAKRALGLYRSCAPRQRQSTSKHFGLEKIGSGTTFVSVLRGPKGPRISLSKSPVVESI